MQAEGPGMDPGIDQGRDRDTSQSLIRRSRRVLLALVFVLVAGAGPAAAVFDGNGGATHADAPIQRTAAGAPSNVPSSTTSSTTLPATTTTLPPTTAAPVTTLPPLPAAGTALPTPQPSPLEA